MEQQQIDDITQAWDDLIYIMVEILDRIKRAIIEAMKPVIRIITRLFNLPIFQRWYFYHRLRTRHQWIPERWAEFLAWHCPMWIVVRMGAID